jgi:hypothetical protein
MIRKTSFWHSESVRGLSLALLCLVCVIYPLVAGPGPVNTRGGGDSPFLLIRLEQMVAGLRSGAFPVRWMPDAAYGLGYPFFNFYAALPYYIATGLRLVGWGPILSLQVTQALGFVLAALATALLARRVLHSPAAVALAVVAYTCAPFHLVNVYVRGDSLSEFYAFVFYPLILWALHRVQDQSSTANVALLALSYGGLVLTHNLSALMFSPYVALYALFLLGNRLVADRAISGNSLQAPVSGASSAFVDREHLRPQVYPKGCEGSTRTKRDKAHIANWHAWRTALAMLGGGLLGLALSATLLLAATGDLDAVWMGSKEIQTSGFFHYAAQFRGRDLVQPALLFDYDIAARTPFSMGLIQAMTIGAGLIAVVAGWIRRRAHSLRARPWTASWVGGLLLSTWVITPLSRPLWDVAPNLALPIVQFPWRFLSIQALFGALIAGELARRLPRPWWVAAAGTALLILGAVGGLRPGYLPIGERDVTPERLALFELFSTNIGTTIRGEYLPVQVEPRPYASAVTLHRGDRPAPVALSGAIEAAELVQRSARSEQWQVTVDSQEAHLAFHTLYFPGWRCRVDGQPTEVEPLPSSGLISVRVPRGAHRVELRFGRTAGRWIADLLSLSALIAVAILLWPTMHTLWSIGSTRDRRSWRKSVPFVVSGIVVVAVLWAAGRAASTSDRIRSDDDLSMDFDRMPLLHHNPQGIDFGVARLSGYAYPESVAGGGQLDVELRWAAWDPALEAWVALVAPSATHPDLQPAPWPLTQHRASVDGPRTRHTLDVPPDAAQGMYYLALRLFDDREEVRAANARGQTLGTTYLRPLWIENARLASEDDPVLANLGDRILLRDDVQVEADEASWQVKLTWQATRPLPVNYSYGLHVLAADGTDLARRDLEGGPGYGFWPTSAWPAGEWLTDRVRIAKPPDVRAEDAAALSVVLYDRSRPGLPAAGSAVVPLVEREHVYEAPSMAHTVGARFGGALLLGYDLRQDASTLRLTLHWQAVSRMETDWTVFVHLLDPQTEEIAAQWDAKPLRGAYPTRWWRAGEVVSEEVVIDLADVPAGSYRLSVGLYDAADWRRPPVTTASGEAVPDGRLVLEEEVVVEGSP